MEKILQNYKKYFFKIYSWFGTTILSKVVVVILFPIILLPMIFLAPLYLIFYDWYFEAKEDFFNIRSLDQAIGLIVDVLIKLVLLGILIGPFFLAFH